ncbi:hypothetical protein BN133_1590 [Cronobacter dublinensis 582]|nr:hypothetical protein BN133_1590 [Cronobacter dublinensis 582]
MILGAQRAHQLIAAEQADFADAPVAAVQVKHPVGQQRLVGAVKRAEAEMHDAALQGAAVISWALNRSRQRGGSDILHFSHILITII